MTSIRWQASPTAEASQPSCANFIPILCSLDIKFQEKCVCAVTTCHLAKNFNVLCLLTLNPLCAEGWVGILTF